MSSNRNPEKSLHPPFDTASSFVALKSLQGLANCDWIKNGWHCPDEGPVWLRVSKLQHVISGSGTVWRRGARRSGDECVVPSGVSCFELG